MVKCQIPNLPKYNVHDIHILLQLSYISVSTFEATSFISKKKFCYSVSIKTKCHII